MTLNKIHSSKNMNDQEEQGQDILMPTWKTDKEKVQEEQKRDNTVKDE